jgi:hypothetical protein
MGEREVPIRLKKRNLFANVDVGGRIILKWIRVELNVRV